MSSSIQKKTGKNNKKNRIKKGLWMKNMLTRRILLPFYSIGSNIRENIQKKLDEQLYNKCSKEGYIKSGSIKILSYSSGLVEADNVVFEVMFECDVCHPVEGQIIKCQVKNITRAGIRAIYTKEKISPITVFVARDHHYNNEAFLKVKENEEITIRVIGIRYELHDETISVLGELKSSKINKTKTKVTIIEE